VAGTAEWKALTVKAPGKDYLEKARNVLETLVLYLEILKSILQTIELFLIDFGNPIRALVEALLKLVQQLFEALSQTGVFAYYDVPTSAKDPSFHRFVGGYQGFTQRFIGSLHDRRDPWRPQPSPGITKSAFLLIVADAETVFGLLRLLKILMRFFGKDFLSPQYAAPANAKVRLVGAKPGSSAEKGTDPILQVASVFTSSLKGLAVEWSLPTNTLPPDPGFQGLVTHAAREFIPTKFLIEKTSEVGGPKPVYDTIPTVFEDKSGRIINRKVKVVEEHGDVFRKFEKYIVVSPSESTATFLLGQLGTFRYVDTDVEKDKTYYYRVRAFSGPLAVNADGTMTFGAMRFDPISGGYVMEWPSSEGGSNAPVIGRPTGIMSGRVPTVPTDFDVIGNLEKVFLAAYSMGFHLPADENAKFDPKTGKNIDGTSVIQIGRGSLADVGGVLSSLLIPTFEAPPKAEPDPVSGAYPDVYFNFFFTKQQARRLAQTVGRALLENSEQLAPFRTLMRGALKYPLSGAVGNVAGVNTTEEMVAGFTKLPAKVPRPDAPALTAEEEADPLGGSNNAAYISFPELYAPDVYATFQYAYTSAEFRLNLLAIVRFIKSFTLGGTPPDWQSASLLRDIIPWSGKFLYDLLARIDALLAAFKSVLDEIKSFIDLLVRKIEVLERFLKFLIEILNFLDSFSAGFYFLKSPSMGGGVDEWRDVVLNAGGTPPPSGPGGYTGGVALAYVAPDIAAFETALGILFG
jgi:hypothetical protein